MKRMLLGLLALVAVIALVAMYREHRKITDNAFEQNFVNEYGVTDAEADKAIQDAKNEGFE